MTKRELLEYLTPFDDEVQIYVNDSHGLCDGEPTYVPSQGNDPAYVVIWGFNDVT